MGLSAATGVFAMRTTDGDDTIALVDQLGAGFAGKALWLWATLATAEDTTTTSAVLAYGISDGNNHGAGLGEFSVCASMQDATNPTNANRYHAKKALVLTDAAGAIKATAVAAWSGNNLVLTWDWTGAGTAYLIHYLVLGGTDLTNARVLTFTAKVGTGSQARTGFGFKPDCLNFLTAQFSTNPDPPVGGALGQINGGWAADKASRKYSYWGISAEDNVATSNTGGYNNVAAPLLSYYVKFGGYVDNGIISAINSYDSDGFTENWLTAAGAAWYYGVMALKGLQYDINAEGMPTTGGDHAITGLGFAPVAVLHNVLGSVNTTANICDIGIGAFTSTSNEHAAWMGSASGVIPTQDDERSTATYHLLHMTPGTPTLDVQVSLVSLDADGWTENPTTVPALARGHQWVAFGAAASTGNRRRALAQLV